MTTFAFASHDGEKKKEGRIRNNTLKYGLARFKDVVKILNYTVQF